ncbi:MAG: NAD(P)H-dependent oxidoreductase subunit E [Candidatus Zixiibacteriota bacterium]|nr:MAG: NAD(P)H-dependent oxidoreductase subunit E [candidate division Zixibacteria bacterium]
MALTAQEVMQRWDFQRDCLIEMLHDVQSEYHYLPREVVEGLSHGLKVSVPQILEVATFYNAFSLTPKGQAKFNLVICNGTLCYARQAPLIIEQFESELGLKVGGMTPDGIFGLEESACLGVCGLAPVMIINGEEVVGRISQDRIPKLISELRGRAEREKHKPRQED